MNNDNLTKGSTNTSLFHLKQEFHKNVDTSYTMFLS